MGLMVGTDRASTSSARLDTDDATTWASETLSVASSRTFKAGSFDFGYDVNHKRASVTSFASASSSETIRARVSRVRRSSIREVVTKTFTFLTVLPRISSARNELSVLRRRSVPAPLYGQKRVLNDLLEVTRDELPLQMRKSALKLIQYSFGHLVREIFPEPARRQLLKTLRELCCVELPYDLRKEGLLQFNYLVGAGAGLGSKNFALEYDDCRIILHALNASTLVPLKLASCACLWLSYKMFAEHAYNPLSVADLKDICVLLVDLSRHPLPIDTRRDALDWLWRFEYLQPSDLPDDVRRSVRVNILEVSGYTESNGFLLYKHSDSENDCLAGLRRLWWFSTLRYWEMDVEREARKLRKVGTDLLSITDVSRSYEIRRQGYELIALFSNLSQWRDMYDDRTWKMVSDEFAEFCLRDNDRVDKEAIKRRVEVLLARSTITESTPNAVTLRKEMQAARRVPGVVIRYGEMTAAKKAVSRYCGLDTTVEALLENLHEFILPGDSLFIQQDQHAILYDRICNYAKFQQTRLIATQAMFALLTLQQWLSGITFAKGPPM